MNRCLQIVYKDKQANFNELLVKDDSVSIHHQYLRKATVDMFKFSRGLSLKIVNELFHCREQISYELRQRSQLQIFLLHLVFRGTESLKCLRPKI